MQPEGREIVMEENDLIVSKPIKRDGSSIATNCVLILQNMNNKS